MSQGCTHDIDVYSLDPDVGHGTGESLILLLSDPSVHRPSSLTGITSLPAHHRRSHDRIAQLQPSPKDLNIVVNLYRGDAVYHTTSIGHPLDRASNLAFDIILALDCAYHFNTRNAFLRQSFEKLAPGGRIALADICIDPMILSQNRLARIFIPLLGVMPQHNFTSTNEYVSAMKDIGYSDVRLEDVSSDVFPGFTRFLKGRGWGWWFFGCVVECCASWGAQFVIISGQRSS